jgi:hypothetical protein
MWAIFWAIFGQHWVTFCSNRQVTLAESNFESQSCIYIFLVLVQFSFQLQLI